LAFRIWGGGFKGQQHAQGGEPGNARTDLADYSVRKSRRRLDFRTKSEGRPELGEQ